MMRLTTRTPIAGKMRLVTLERHHGAYWVAQVQDRPDTEAVGRTADMALRALEKRLARVAVPSSEED